MEIKITVKKGVIEIILLSGKKELDNAILKDERQLFERLLPEIDKLLKKNKLFPGKVGKIKVVSDQKDTFTTTRIAQAVAKTWNWVNEFDPVEKLDKQKQA